MFLEGLLREFAKFDEFDLRVYGSTKTEQWLASFLNGGAQFQVVGGESPGILNRFLATRKLRSIPKAGDVLWAPLNQGVGATEAEEVVTIHDLIPLHYSQRRPEYEPSWKRRLAFTARWKNSMRVSRKAAAVITVSNTNVDELQQEIGVNGPKVYGAPNGIDPVKKAAALKAPWQYSGKRDVIAVTSGSKPHKGIRTLEKVADRLPDFKFRVIGKLSGIDRPNILQTGKLSADELNDAFRNASALFFPSRIEGFGLPVLEAAVFGTPVVATDIPVLREVGGPASMFFKMDDIDEAANRLQMVVETKEKAESMSVAGKQHASQFTWGRAADVYRGVFHDVSRAA